MVAFSNFAVLVLGALVAAKTTVPAPSATSTASSSSNSTSIKSYGGSEGLALQIFVHHVVDSKAGQLCVADDKCNKALHSLSTLVQKTKAVSQKEKRKTPGLSIFGGPWGLAYSLIMSTDEGQEINGMAVSAARKLCNQDATCKVALAGYDKYVKPVTDKVDQVETEAEDAVFGKAEDVVGDAVKKIF